jgi:hypothetical protein
LRSYRNQRPTGNAPFAKTKDVQRDKDGNIKAIREFWEANLPASQATVLEIG